MVVGACRYILGGFAVGTVKRGYSAFTRRLSILLVLGAAVSSIHCVGPAQRPANVLPPPKHGGVYVVAHRGAHDGIPENTLAAYKAAIEMGVDLRTTILTRLRPGGRIRA